MPPLFHPAPVNGPFDDPGIYVDFLFERRAILFDLGDTTPLRPRKILRISDIFVSQTHLDHFIGFDRVLRICLGREKRLRLYGPPGFADQVAHLTARQAGELARMVPFRPKNSSSLTQSHREHREIKDLKSKQDTPFGCIKKKHF